jgi:hypothetical protein
MEVAVAKWTQNFPGRSEETTYIFGGIAIPLTGCEGP